MSHQPEENDKIDSDFTIAEAEVEIGGDARHCFV